MSQSTQTGGSEHVETLEGYEYVIVGSGAGGGPLAANLARKGHKVLLLEAGDDQGSNIKQQVPAFHFASTEDESMRWDYFVNHYADPKLQKDSKMTWETPEGKIYVGLKPPTGSKPKGILYPRAGTLGGCTAHNAMITIYPHDNDWANIAELTGDSSWDPDNMRKYFERLERCEYVKDGTPGHGFDGWLGTNRADLKLALTDVKLLSIIGAAASAMGTSLLALLPQKVSQLLGLLLRDVNSNDRRRDMTEGIYQIPLAMSKGKRNGTRELLVETAKKYPLEIRTCCLATRILFDDASAEGSVPKAVGVEFLQGKSLYKADPRYDPNATGTKHRVLVSREVIIAAGAFGTPQLLKLSGIGPKEELNKFGIPVVKDLPGVGTNLQDRYEIPIVTKLEDEFPITAKCTFGQPGDPCLAEWKENRGPYITNGLPIGIVKKSTQAENDPDLFVFGGPGFFKGYYPGYSELTSSDVGKRHFTWAVLKAHTRNQDGTVKLNSADPRDVPDIDFNYFVTTADEQDESAKDLRGIAEGLNFARHIMDSVVPLATGRLEEASPGRHISSPGQINEFIRNEAWGHHASCSCPIGPETDPKSVLDSRFRVRGVGNLRVVDASVFPRIPGFFIAVPIYMISEKASDVILEDAA